MGTITYNVTDAQLAEMLLALDHHKTNPAGTADVADVKAFGLQHFQRIVQDYRESVIAAANPVDSTAVAS